jgi:hypothetical protein
MRRRIGLLWLVVAAGVACEGQVVPLTAQQGSTILIPLANSNLEGGVVGYGGTDIVDDQRGELVYYLDQIAPGNELTTRGSGVAFGSYSSPFARGDDFSLGGQVISIVDIPIGAPLGPHDVIVQRERGGTPLSSPSFNGSIVVMENSIDFGSFVAVGQPTPFASWNDAAGAYFPAGDLVPSQAPDPELRITFQLPPGVELWAAELAVSYDPGVIVVEDVVEPVLTVLNHRAVVWYDEPAAGQLTIGAAGMQRKFSNLSIVYTLVDGATEILDPNDVVVMLDKATDATGADISGSVTLLRRIF